MDEIRKKKQLGQISSKHECMTRDERKTSRLSNGSMNGKSSEVLLEREQSGRGFWEMSEPAPLMSGVWKHWPVCYNAEMDTLQCVKCAHYEYHMEPVW